MANEFADAHPSRRGAASTRKRTWVALGPLLGLFVTACGGLADLGGTADAGDAATLPWDSAALPWDSGTGVGQGDTGQAPHFDAAAPPQDAANDGAVDLPPACYAAAALTPLPPWKPPTPFHQGLCSTGALAQYETCWDSPNCSSGNSACDACLRTDIGAAAFGPVITGSTYADMYNGAFVNWGGCQANLDGNTGQGSCGSQTNIWQVCDVLNCPQGCGADLMSCEDYAAIHICKNDTESLDCSNEWAGDSGVPQCNLFATLASLWCGP